MKKFIETVIHAVQTWTDDKIKRSKKQLDDRISNSSADWNQNDSNADSYVKNRPFYKEENIEELIFDGEVHFDENGCYYFDPQIKLIDGTNYTIVFDGHVYNGVAYYDDASASMTIDVRTVSGDFLYLYDNYISLSGQSANTTHYIKIFIGSLRVAKKIDAMFIPEDIRKMSTLNPSGNGSFSMNLRTNTVIGDYSHTEGRWNEASGEGSHAEGYNTEASGSYSHAEGYNTEASGHVSHAEGDNTEASGHVSHAEGYYTIARTKSQSVSGEFNIPEEGGYLSNEERLKSYVMLCPYPDRGNIYFCDGYTFDKNTGLYTLVPVEYESVSNDYSSLYSKRRVYIIYGGESGTTMYDGSIYHDGTTSRSYVNVNANSYKHTSTHSATTRGKYARIVGNGTRGDKRSNAHTLDWNGVGWYQGGLQVGGNAQDDGAKNVLLEGDAIPVPEIASIGQTLAVKSVDENGKPTEWEVVDASTGGGSDYILTEADKQEIAEMAAELVDIPEIGGFIAQDTAPEDTSMLWIDTSDDSVDAEVDCNYPGDEYINQLITNALPDVSIDDEYINSLIDAKLGVIENGTY